MINIEVVQNDITRQAIDAIVTAANERRLGGGGVEGATHAAAGPELLDECRTLAGCPTGEAKITGGYRLPARYVIHTVGPVWQGGGSGEHIALASCYESSLQLAEAKGLRSIAFPAISTGVFGYPLEAATRIAVNTVVTFPATNLNLVRFVCFDTPTASIYRALVYQSDDVLETNAGVTPRPLTR
ncbi:MAG: O-acetyl-ADP-ribose deacetylase [Gammaproteobacteria bacterium]|nr:O-acetyl-ADP-ribose deacetylase [Gammaproteobacteria bacterium]